MGQDFAAGYRTLQHGTWGERIGVFSPSLGNLVAHWHELSPEQAGSQIGHMLGATGGGLALGYGLGRTTNAIGASLRPTPLKFQVGSLNIELAESSTINRSLSSNNRALALSREPNPALLDLSKTNGQIWSIRKDMTSLQNARKHWRDHGSHYPHLLNSKQYVEASHNFLKNPPPDCWTNLRPNGDFVMYDPIRNNFGVLTSKGVPRTLFKPEEGLGYKGIRDLR